MIDYDFVLNDEETIEEKEQTETLDIKDVFDIEVAKSKLKTFDVADIEKRAVALIVNTDEGAKQGVAMAMQCRKFSNSIEKARKEIVRPHLDFQKAVKKYSDEFADFFKKTEKGLLEKVEKFQVAKELELKKAIAEQVRKETEIRLKREKEQREFDEAIRLRDIEIERAKIKAEKEDMPLPTPPPLPEVPMPIIQEVVLPVVATPQKIESEEGSSSTVMEWFFEIEDASIVPRDFLVVDERAVKRAVASGVRHIDGVKIYEKAVRKYRVKG